MSKVVSPFNHLRLCRDRDDDKWLEIAVEARADYVITWDKDLLSLRGKDGTITIEGHTFKILRPIEFYHEVIKREC